MHVHPTVGAQIVNPLSVTQISHLSDEQVLAQLRAGNNDALAVLFDRYHRLVYSIALKIVRDASDAEDVMQNVFFEIFRSVAKFDSSRGTCKVWLLQYAYHRAINRRQQLNAKNFYNLASMEDAEVAVSKKQLGFGRFTQGELKHLIRQGLASLNVAQKRVIDLATYQGLSMQEISVQTGESLVNVRHHYYRGLKKLRSFVDDVPAVQKRAG
jgi:RNA polymerase sigma-70 factor (ECF subfamily)